MDGRLRSTRRRLQYVTDVEVIRSSCVVSQLEKFGASAGLQAWASTLATSTSAPANMSICRQERLIRLKLLS